MNRLAPELPEAPEVQLCRCGEPLILTIMSLPGGDRLIPISNPCPECKEHDDKEKRRARARGRLLASGIPERLHGFSMAHTTPQGPGMDLARWMSDVRQSRKLGISIDDGAIWRAAEDWTPEDGSVWIEGKVGRGKSVLAAAMLTKVLGVDLGSTHRLYDDDELERRGWAGKGRNRGCVRVAGNSKTGRMITESELMAAKKKTHGYKDDGEWDRLCDVDVVVLDDLGTEGDHPMVVKVIHNFIDTRYRKRKPIIFSTNLGWTAVVSMVAPLYGAPVRSRLMDAVRGRVWLLRGDDWRTA